MYEPVNVANCAYLTALFHLGAWLARIRRLLYFFSNRSCCCGVSSLNLGGHTFRALYGFDAAEAVSVIEAPAALEVTLLKGSRALRSSVGIITDSRYVAARGGGFAPDE